MSHILATKKYLDLLNESYEQGDLNQFSGIFEHLKNEYQGKSSVIITETDIRLLLLSVGKQKLLSLCESESDSITRFRNQGLIHLMSDDAQSALVSFSALFEIQPDDALGCYWAGKACVSVSLYKEALQLFLSPGSSMVPETYIQVAKVLMGQGKDREALSYFQKSAELENTDISWLTYVFALKDVLSNGNIFDQELEEQYLALLVRLENSDIEYKAEAYGLHGDACLWNGGFGESLGFYTKALELKPDVPTVRPSLGYSLLALEHFNEGFPFVAYRHELFVDTALDGLSTAEWFGEDLSDKHILVYAEQGIGDQVFLLRYLPLLASAFSGVRISVVCDQRLIPIIARSFEMEVTLLSSLAQLKSPDDLDYFVRTTELQAYLERFDRLELCSRAKYISEDSDKKAYLKRRYQNEFGDRKLKIGLCWKSFGFKAGHRKSIELEFLKELFSFKDIQWVSLQMDTTDEDILYLQQTFGIALYRDVEVNAKASLDDLCAQISVLDAVVSVSSSIVHLAGALGIPTYCLVPMKSFWYWHTSNGPSRWYKSVSLFRQTSRIGWEDPVSHLVSRLSEDLELKTQSEVTKAELATLINNQDYISIKNLYLRGLISHSDDLLLDVAKAFIAAGWLDDAVTIVKPILEVDMSNVSACLLFSEIAIKKGMPQQALSILSDLPFTAGDIDLPLQLLRCHIELCSPLDELMPLWKEALKGDKFKVSKINSLSTFLADQRDILVSSSSVNTTRISFLHQAVTLFNDRFEKANPVVFHAIKGELYNFEGETAKAMAHYEKAIVKRPEYESSFKSNIAFCLLSLGEYKKGFELNKARLHDERLLSKDTVQYSHIPYLNRIDGTNLSTLLIISEQGVGDQVLGWQFLLKFSELLPDTRFIFTVPQRLVKAAKQTLGDRFEVCSEIYEIPEATLRLVDKQIYLGDIASFLFSKTDHFSPIHKFLKPDTELVEHYRSKYRSMFPGKKLLGLSWRSKSATWGGRKDIDLSEFKGLLKLAGWQAISVQYGASQEEITSKLGTDAECLYLDTSFDSLKSFDHCIAQIAALDHVVTVSNVNAHFAGALGIGTSLLLKRLALWHWGNKPVSDWYPDMKIYREEAYDHWDGMFDLVQTEITAKS